MPNEKRQVQFISPISKGDQFKSFKTRPNNPCLCGSGRKQKKCCGDGSKLMSTNKKRVSADKETQTIKIPTS